ncbi:MAG: p-hydroxycinnamoyl CoA hydratase/lyase [Deltaproteobacteria bacterium]|nr:p-hydroxycinnamoyl CoA hydratase/lyase [Deltaproteobacteria bacterium]
MATKEYQTVLVEKEDGITWVILNRPEKRNAMSPQLHFDMYDAVTDCEGDPETQVMIITGAGNSWCAGQDLKEYFREGDKNPQLRRQASWCSQEWRWRKLFTFPKPTIAMVNGFCFGGAFTPLVACDFAIASDDALFGLSEVNWGILPGGLVSRVVTDMMTLRDGLYHAMTGDPFDGKRAAEMRLVNYSVPADQLRDETVKLAKKLMEKNPWALRATKQAYKLVRGMDYSQAEDYLAAKGAWIKQADGESGYDEGIKQFIDDKTYKPGLGPMARVNKAS